MSQQSLARLAYETPEEAASMAAMINNSQYDGAVKAIAEGRSLAIVPVNPALASFSHGWSRLLGWIVQYSRRAPAVRETITNA